MSNLANFDVNDLLAMAEQFNISLDENPASSSATYTSFTKVEGSRLLSSEWGNGDVNKGSASFLWNVPGEPDEIERFAQLPVISQLGGFIVHAEVQSSLSHYDSDSGQSKNYCSLTGHRNGKGELVRGLPNVPLRSMYGKGWDAVGKHPIHTIPNPLVKDLGLVGSRGSSCHDCILAGQSHLPHPTDSNRFLECTPYGRMFFWLTEVSGIIKKQMQTFTIRELLDQPGVLLIMNLPTKTALRGHFVAKDSPDNIQGYFGYLGQLAYQAKNKNPGLASPYMHYTRIGIKAPPAGAKSPKNFLHFESTSPFDIEQLKTAWASWGQLNPNKEVELLDPAEYQGVQVMPPESGMRSAAVMEEAVEVPATKSPW